MSQNSVNGITFRICDKAVEEVKLRYPVTPADVLCGTWQRSTYQTSLLETRYTKCKDLLQSSIPKDSNIVPQSNGFVDTVLMAYNRHHKLVIRPDDIWITILSQLSIYVNAHAEELRKFFVAHEGKKNLVVGYDGIRHTFDFSIMARDFSGLLRENINDPSLYEFIIPNFSTTTHNDTVTCSIMMMAIFKAYFSYTCMMTCGIPEITLLGTKEDYENILHRVERLEEMGMGSEPRTFAMLLKPIIKQFINVFEAVAAAPEAPQIDTEFWGRICHVRRFGSGSSSLSGWITTFCVWDKHGKWVGPNCKTFNAQYPRGNRFETDEMHFPVISTSEIPPGWCEADVKLIDHGTELNCIVVAGHLAMEVKKTGPSNIMGALAPAPHWFMFEKEEVVEKREVEEWMKPFLPSQAASE